MLTTDAPTREAAVRGLREYVDAHLGRLHRKCVAAGKAARFAECAREGLRAWSDADWEADAAALARARPQLALDLQQSFYAWAAARGRRPTLPPVRALLQPLLRSFVADPFVACGAYFAPTTAPLHKKDCLADALVAACEQCEREGYAADGGEGGEAGGGGGGYLDDDLQLFPSDSVSQVGSPARSRVASVAPTHASTRTAASRAPEVVLVDHTSPRADA